VRLVERAVPGGGENERKKAGKRQDTFRRLQLFKNQTVLRTDIRVELGCPIGLNCNWHLRPDQLDYQQAKRIDINNMSLWERLPGGKMSEFGLVLW